jgi:hypothetical protein
MDRRGFLGVLAALPIVQSIIPKSDQPPTMEEAEKILGASINDPIWSEIGCSGVIQHNDVYAVSGSGFFRY